MADTPTTLLAKALARRGDSGSSKPHWRELMTRHDTVPATRAVQAPEVIKGFYGSWAAQFGSAEGHSDEQVPYGPPPVGARTNRLGLPGMAEINFRPYDWGTTRDGEAGPSLLGHPISFQVVGPTLRDRGCLWQWRVDTTGSQDRFILDNISALSTPANVVASPVADLDESYGLTAIPEEGLYLVVLLTGDGGDIDNGAGGTVPGGVGDGQFGEDATPPGGLARLPLGPKAKDSKYEIFRVTGLTETLVANDTLVLDGGKRLSDYFDIPNPATNTPVCRAVMLIKPAAARVVAVPNSGEKGKEQVFAIVPPERSLNADLMPARVAWDTDGLFDPFTAYTNTGTNFVGDAGDYAGSNALPIPRADSRGRCRLQGINGETVQNLPTGQMRVMLADNVTRDPNAAGKVLRLLDIESRGSEGMANAASEGAPFVADKTVDQLLGYWEIIASGENLAGDEYYDLRMVPQFDPSTGIPFFGHANLLKMETGATPGAAVWFNFTIHKSIKDLWTSAYAVATDIDAARLQNLIDPSWVDSTVKGRGDATIGHLGRADRAIFDTSTSNAGASGSNANPGSLADLGFRVVLFPAKRASGNRLVPDFDRPLDANEVVLDPTKIGEDQYIEVDYSAGLIRLSHAPVAGVGCTLAPNADILTSPANPRGEMVFFVSCVPFSREPGQMGSGMRVTAGDFIGPDQGFCNTDQDQEHKDLYGDRLFWPAANQTIQSGIHRQIQLNTVVLPTELPPAGFVDVVKGDADTSGIPGLLNQGERVCTYGYTSVIYQDAGNGGNTTLAGVFGGGTAAQSITVNGASPHTVVLRRNILTPNDVNGQAGVHYQFDTTYGWAKRPSALRFQSGSMKHERDGSVTISLESRLATANRRALSDLFSSWILNGGEMTSTGLGGGFGDVLDFNAMTVLVRGLRSRLAPTSFQVSTSLAPKHIYIYVDGTDPECPTLATTDTLPLPNSQDILIGEYDHDGTDVLSYTDLRHLLNDVDKRLDITVGAPTGHAQPGIAHFSQLADAVEYVSKTMTPTAGAKGQFRRIKVIGPTQEIGDKLPIRVPDGLIIEGAGRELAAAQSIQWSTTESLFDLTGATGVQFRDLVFNFDQGVLPPSANALERNLFLADDGLVSEAVFENIYLGGNAHAFFFHNGGGLGTGVLEASFTDCFAANLTDHAIRVEATAAVCERVRIQRCTFTVRKDVAVPGPELGLTHYGIIHLANSVAEDVTIRDCALFGGDIGVYADVAKQVMVDNCWIKDTDQVGVFLDGVATQVIHCTLEAVHTVEAGASTVHIQKAGIYQSGGKNVYLADNSITLADSNTQDHSIVLAAGVPDNQVISNIMDRGLLAGSFTRIHANIIGGGNMLLNGGSNRCSNNSVEGNLQAASQSENIFHGDHFAGDGLHLSGNNTAYTNVIFGDPSDGTPAGRVQLGDDNIFTGCVFANGFQDGGAAKSRNRFENCSIRWNTSNIDIAGDDNLFIGNKIIPDDNDAVFDIEGNGTVFCGNQCLSGGTFYFHSSSGERQEYVISDNLIREDGATPPRGGLFVFGSYCTISGNVIRGRESLSPSPDLYSLVVAGRRVLVVGNTAEDGILLDIHTSTVADNHTSGPLNIPSGTYTATGDCTVTGNTVQGFTVIDLLGSSVSGNFFNSTVALTADDMSFTGNTVGSILTIQGDDQTVTGNRLLSTVIATTNTRLSFKDNIVDGAVTVGSADGLKQDLVGNLFRAAVSCLATGKLVSSVIDGNDFEVNPNFSNSGTVSLENCTITGNRGLGMTAQYSSRCTFSGNRFTAALDLTESVEPVVQGNFLGSTSGIGTVNLTLSGADNYVVVGNRVTGTIVLDTGAGEADTGIVVGNRAGEIAAGTTPTNGAVAVANKVDNGNQVFGASPGTASVVTNNNTD